MEAYNIILTKVAVLKVADAVEFFLSFYNCIYIRKDLEGYEVITVIIWHGKIMQILKYSCLWCILMSLQWTYIVLKINYKLKREREEVYRP